MAMAAIMASVSFGRTVDFAVTVVVGVVFVGSGVVVVIVVGRWGCW